MNYFKAGKKFYFIVLIMIFAVALNYPEERNIRSIDSIISDIRKEQGLKESDKINPDKVSPRLLDELGDSIMDRMAGSSDRHELMDRMMGGEGSQNLISMHQRMAYNYLSGNSSRFNNNMGFGYSSMPGYDGMMGMMYGYPYNNNNGNRGGYPMMWNNGYGMMGGWGFGGMIMGFIFLIVIIAVVLIIIFAIKSRGTFANISGNETPLDILKKRYAKGEISKEDFEKMKKDIL